MVYIGTYVQSMIKVFKQDDRKAIHHLKITIQCCIAISSLHNIVLP